MSMAERLIWLPTAFSISLISLTNGFIDRRRGRFLNLSPPKLPCSTLTDYTTIHATVSFVFGKTKPMQITNLSTRLLAFLLIKLVIRIKEQSLSPATIFTLRLDLAPMVEVAVDPISSTVEPLSQSVYFVDGPRKLDLLLTLLASDQIARALVFTRTKRRADRLTRSLTREGVEAEDIHGDKSQTARVRTLEGFKRGRTRVLVATDVAARGIHVEDIDTVINFDIPSEPEIYVHRVGRTGRAGASGTAVSLCGADEREQLTSIERLTRRKIQKLETPDALNATRGRQSSARPEREHRPEAGRRTGASNRRRGRARRRRSGVA